MVRLNKPLPLLKIVVDTCAETELPKSSLPNPQIPYLPYDVGFTPGVDLSVEEHIFFRLYCSFRWSSLPRDRGGFVASQEEFHRP